MCLYIFKFNVYIHCIASLLSNPLKMLIFINPCINECCHDFSFPPHHTYEICALFVVPFSSPSSNQFFPPIQWFSWGLFTLTTTCWSWGIHMVFWDDRRHIIYLLTSMHTENGIWKFFLTFCCQVIQDKLSLHISHKCLKV